jgi:hypothetical protein
MPQISDPAGAIKDSLPGFLKFVQTGIVLQVGSSQSFTSPLSTRTEEGQIHEYVPGVRLACSADVLFFDET